MRILLVEDEPDLLRTVTRTLREAGFAVDTADNGADGLDKAQDCDYDLIVLDVLLPKLNGWDLLCALRKSKKTPVLMLTARDALTDRVRGLNNGADDYLTKPFEFDELLARINAVIRRSAGQALPQIQLGDVTIDTAAKKVFRNGEEVVLTAREHSLLEFLALHRGQVVTRTMLYDHMLGENDDTMSNLMDVYVGNIRRKLGGNVIMTRRGLGYIIE
jgi:two-component system OmpR family response regulator